MNVFKRYFLLLIVISLLVDCKSKKKPLPSGDDPVEFGDFIEFFPESGVPFSFADSMILRREKDSMLISHAIFTTFVPDSLLKSVFGNSKPRFFPVARFQAENEQYLLAKGISTSRRGAIIVAFDKKGNYLDLLPFLIPDALATTTQTGSIDRNFGIHKNVTRRNQDGSVSEGKDVFGFTTGINKFTLIMTDALDDKITELINPIDTAARTHKFAGDYGTGKMNIVSIRDGRRSDRLSFFIHINKSQGSCTGELKGEAIFRTPTMAEYRLGGDPCVLRLSFTSNSVTVKEIEGCGAHRTLRCSFDGRYEKKKVTKKKTVKK